MTIPAGCYIVPSGYNVVPALTCTASSSSSGPHSTGIIPTISSSSRMSLITSMSFSSSAAPLSSSVVSTAVSTAKSSQVSSSASTPQSSSIVSSASTIAASNPSSSTVSSSASVAAPASTTAGASPASSSAVQSSALPLVLGGAVGKVTNAQNLGKTFEDNPSTDTQNAVKQAVDDAKNGNFTPTQDERS